MPPKIRYDPYTDIDRAQGYAREGVKAYGELLRPDLMKEIGSTLGGLNEIGALRSGQANVQLNEIGQNYADRVGQYASTATLGAMNTGINAGGLRLDERRQSFAEDEARRARKNRLLSSIGSVVGAGIGFAVGGPPGAAAGYSAASGAVKGGGK